MTELPTPVQAQAALSDARTTPAMLQTIAAEYPHLWPLVAAHPNAYDGLLDWLDQVGDPQARTVVATRRARAAGVLTYGGAPAPAVQAPEAEPPGTVTATGGLDHWFGAEDSVADPADQAPPDPAPPRQPVHQASASEPERRPPWLIPVLAGAGGLILVLAVVLILVLTGRDDPTTSPTTSPTAAGSTGGVTISGPDTGLEAARAGFDLAAAEFETAQNQLAAAVEIGQGISQRVPAEQVGDAGVLQRLGQALTGAEAVVGTVPDPAGTLEALTAQTGTLQEQTAAANAAAQTVTQATEAVQTARVEFASDLLEAAIEAAQSVYDDAAEPIDNLTGTAKEAAVTARTELETQLEAARTAADGLAGDPEGAHQTATLAAASLSTASDALAGVLKPTCANGVILPAGIDQRVCQGVPADAIAIPATSGQRTFAMPSGNIGCTAEAYSAAVVCEINRHSWTIPPALAQTCAGDGCGNDTVGIAAGGTVVRVGHSDVPPWANLVSQGAAIPVLPYGQVADFGSAACLSGEAGVTCWDVTTHHGFRIASQALVYW